MKTHFTIALLFSLSLAHSQGYTRHYYDNIPIDSWGYMLSLTDDKYIIIDEDGYANMRSSPSANAPVMTTVPQYAVVTGYMRRQGNWQVVSYANQDTRDIYYGYVHNSRLLKIPRSIVRKKYNVEFAHALTLKIIGVQEELQIQMFFTQNMGLGFIAGENREINYMTSMKRSFVHAVQEARDFRRPINYYVERYRYNFEYEDFIYIFEDYHPGSDRLIYYEGRGETVFIFDIVDYDTISKVTYYLPRDGNDDSKKSEVIIIKNIKL
jgi:hypothetical protein